MLEARKTKESLRSSIHKLRDQNTLQEEQLNTLTREKTALMNERSSKEKTERDLLIKLDRAEKALVETETENERINDKLEKVERERVSLTDQLATSESSVQSWRKQLEEVKREKESINKKLSSLSQRERSLQEHEVTLLKEIETSVNNVLLQYPHLKGTDKPDKMRSPDLPLQLKRMLSLHKAVLTELAHLKRERDTFKDSVSSLNKQMNEKDFALADSQRLSTHLKDDFESLRSNSEYRYAELQHESIESLHSFEKERENTGEEMSDLLQANETLEEDIEEVSNSYHSLLEEKHEAKKTLENLEDLFCRTTGRLLAETACLSAWLVVNTESLSESSHEKLTGEIENLTYERSSLRQTLGETNEILKESIMSLNETREEKQKSVLVTDKLKNQLMTEISLLKSQVSTLEKDKTLLEVREYIIY